MKIGLIARADNTGLGNQTFEFYQAMKPFKTMVVDISEYNGNTQHYERYPDGVVVKGFPQPEDISRFLDGLDAVFVAESPYNYKLYSMAKERGVKVAVQYNYEFFDWFKSPDLPTPDGLIAPSTWHYDEIDDWCAERGIQHNYLHCPVNRVRLPFKLKTQAKTFLHIAGKPAAHDRNGTKTVIEASKYIKSDINIKIHFQGEQGLAHQATDNFDDYLDYLNTHGNADNITMTQQEYENYPDIYAEADVLVLPRRYGGNCLPMGEALSTGMPVIMTNISPNRDQLPMSWLIPAKRIGEFKPRTTVSIYEGNPEYLAEYIDAMANVADFADLSNDADQIAGSISWEEMKPRYEAYFERLMDK